MFYCEECRKENKYPESFTTSMGRCEICKTSKYCHDVPSSSLPKPKETVLDVIKGIPQQPQAQYDVTQQLKELEKVAGRLGLYDAAEYLNAYDLD